MAVDKTHVKNLARMMREESEHEEMGEQLLPGLVAQVIEETGECKLYLCDGFHRVEAKIGNGDKSFYATLKTGCTMENVYDLRIVSATSHKPVTFARVVKWVKDAWDLTDWSGG